MMSMTVATASAGQSAQQWSDATVAHINKAVPDAAAKAKQSGQQAPEAAQPPQGGDEQQRRDKE